ncbi:MAG: 2-dehydropantoate 2-reductase [Candidatus Sphingomonas colombiensis]|nr:2-dehydropantoate 2-reductase [Sphingomonas sp.]WEK43965.1 MAG: 2-dehydropantoate 2-reductase [Sphingomonas sp.]
MKIAVIGAGAMGSLFGGRLALAGHDVRLVDVNPPHIAAINRDGLRLDLDEGGLIVTGIRAGTADAFAGPVDLLIVFTKGYHTADALEAAAHLTGPDTWALTLQNGLGTGERIADALPGVPVAIGMTDVPADLKGPGHVGSHGKGHVRLWSQSGTADPALEQIATALSKAGIEAHADPEVATAIWEKVIFNTVMNPVAALTRQTVGGMAGHPDGGPLAEAIMGEAFAVAAACGVPVDQARVRAIIAHAWAEHGPHQPSMLQDVLAGRPTEIDSIAGQLAKKGAAHGVATPVLDTLTRLVRMINRAG